MPGMTGAASSSSESNNSGEGERDAGGTSDMGSKFSASSEVGRSEQFCEQAGK